MIIPDPTQHQLDDAPVGSWIRPPWANDPLVFDADHHYVKRADGWWYVARNTESPYGQDPSFGPASGDILHVPGLVAVTVVPARSIDQLPLFRWRCRVCDDYDIRATLHWANFEARCHANRHPWDVEVNA